MLRGGTMPLTDVDPNLSGRNSRSSNLSSNATRKDNNYVASAVRSETLSGAAGVISMLKTTTETGDINALTVGHTRLPKHRRNALPPSRSDAVSRTSSHYSRSGSIGSKRSNNSAPHPLMHGPALQDRFPKADGSDFSEQQLDRRHIDAFKNSRSFASVNGRVSDGRRSYSLTHSVHPAHSLVNHRSLASLKHQDFGSTRPISPYVYRTRMRRPGHRSASPVPSEASLIVTDRPSGPAFEVGQRGYSPSPLKTEHFPPKGKTFQPIRAQTSPDKITRQPLAGENGGNVSAHERRPATRPYPVALVKVPPTSRPFPPIGVSGRSLDRDVAPVPPATGPKPMETTPYVGFVQRVKRVLEEKASLEDAQRGHLQQSNRKVQGSEQEWQTVEETSISPTPKPLSRAVIRAAVAPSSEPDGTSSPESPPAMTLRKPHDDSSGGNLSSDATESGNVATSTSLPGHTESPNASSQEVTVAPLSVHDQSDGVDTSTDEVNNVVESQSSPFTELCEAPGSLGQQATSKYTIQSTNAENVPTGSPNLRTLELRPNFQEQYAQPPRPQSECPTATQLLWTASTEPKRHSAPMFGGSVEKHTSPSKTFTSLGDAQCSSVTVQSSSYVLEPKKWPSVTRQGFSDDCYNAAAEDSSVTISQSVNDVQISASNDQTDASGEATSSRVSTVSSSCAVRELDITPTSSLRESVVLTENAVPSLQAVASANDSRLSAMRQFQFPLPDLTEDSQEDASVTNLRILGSKPPPFRYMGMKRFRGETKRGTSGSVAPEAPDDYLSRKLYEAQKMPSLNFSHMDLTTKLNRALGFRSSRSLEELKRSSATQVSTRTPEDLLSSISGRQRYKSFFSEYETTDVDDETTAESIQKRSQCGDFVTEVDRLSIPSVSGLTQRLSELLPSIKNSPSQLDVTKSDATLENASEKSRDLGSSVASASIEKKRASLVSSLTAGNVARSRRSGGNVLSTVDEDSSPNIRGNLSLMKDLPPLPPDADGSLRNLCPSTFSRPEFGVTETKSPELPGKTMKNDRNPLLSNDVGIAKSKLTRPSYHTLPGTPDSRPWNKMGSYPWVVEAPMIEISIPRTASNDGSPIARSRLTIRKSRSANDLPLETTERIVRSMSPGPRLEKSLVPQSDLPHDLEDEELAKKDLIGSIKRKMGMKPRVDKAGFPINPVFLHPEDGATEPGDRYPTSGLTPPPLGNIDEARSYFSDDTSDYERRNRTPIRKRITRLAQRPSNRTRFLSRAISSLESIAERQRSDIWDEIEHTKSKLPRETADHEDAVLANSRPAAGMSKIEFRTRRMMEKLRILWAKSGDAIRNMNRARKRGHAKIIEDQHEEQEDGALDAS